MQKCLFIFLLLIFSVAHANWDPYVMDRGRFVHLSEQEKEAVILRTMEIMVELEEKYQREVAVNGFSQKAHEKYVWAMKHIQNFLFSDAVAASGKSLEELGNDFVKLLDKSAAGEACIYGGYVSKVKEIGGVKVCTHPQNVPGPVKDAYLSNGGKCKAPTQISCNPIVFGYENNKNQTPFCVSTGYDKQKFNKAHNVSHECMKKALDEKDHPGVTPKAERIELLKKFMEKSDNEKIVKGVHEFIFKTCLCNSENDKMEQTYIEYIRPHRTCLGMVNTLRSAGEKNCSALVDGTAAADFAKKWNAYMDGDAMKNFPLSKTRDPNAQDNAYSSLLSDERIKNHCESIDKPNKPDDPKPPGPGGGGGDEGDGWKCTANCVKEEKDGKTSWKCTVTEAKLKKKDGKDANDLEDVLGKVDTCDVVVTDPKQTSIKIKINGETAERECPIDLNAGGDDDDKKNSCEIKIEKVDEKKVKATVAYTLQDDKATKSDQTWNGEKTGKDEYEFAFDATKKDEKKEVKFSAKISGMKEALECSATYPPEDQPANDDNPTLTLSQDGMTETSVSVKATPKVNGAEELPSGWIIVWSHKGAGAPPATPPKKEDPKETGRVADEPENDKKGEKEGEEIKPVPIAGEFARGTEKNKIEPRGQKPYETCATMIDDKGKQYPADKCIPIPPIKAPGGGGQQQPMPQPIPRQMFNMSTPMAL